MELRSGAHCVYSLTYHLILVVKYRKPCIDDEMARLIKEKAAIVLEGNHGRLIDANHDRDHIHFLIEVGPGNNLAKLVGVIKGFTSRKVRERFAARLAPYLWGDSFWSDSYFIASTGGVTVEVLKQYVENQGKPKRKYVKKKLGDSSPP